MECAFLVEQFLLELGSAPEGIHLYPAHLKISQAKQNFTELGIR